MTPQDFVSALYRGVLGREPDAGGFAHHVDKFADQVAVGRPSIDIAAEMLRGFVGSEEFRGSSGAIDLLAAPKLDRPHYAHVASLGSQCYTSLLLKQLGLKRYSLPFDWIFSSPGMVGHCLGDDCATLLDPRHYRPKPPALRSAPDRDFCGHDVYARQFGIDAMFNDYDPTTPAGYAYLQRCVGRWRRLLAGDAPKLFLVIDNRPDAADTAPLVRLAAALDQCTRNATLIAVSLAPPSTDPLEAATTVTWRRDTHRLVRMQPRSYITGLAFHDAFDGMTMARLLASFRFDLVAGV